MQRKESATLTTFLPEILNIFTCVISLDDQLVIIFYRMQDLCTPSQNHQQEAPNFKNQPKSPQQPQCNSLYIITVKRYFATNTLSSKELDSFRECALVIDIFLQFQLYLSNKQVAQEQPNQFNYGYEQTSKENSTSSKRAANPPIESVGGQKTFSIKSAKNTT